MHPSRSFATFFTSLTLCVTLVLAYANATARAGNGTLGTSRNGSLGTFAWDTTQFVFAFDDSYTASNWKVEKGVMTPDTGKTTSNGPNWIQYLTREYNASDVLLRNLAANAATLDNALIALTNNETGVVQQVAKFEKYLAPPPDELSWSGNNTLFAVWVGINDCDLSYTRPHQSKWHKKEFKVWNGIQEKLYGLGARHFLFMTVPPTYYSPLFYHQLTLKTAIKDYNKQLRSNAIAFHVAHPDAVVLFYDAFTSFSRILDNSWQEGFRNTTKACPQRERATQNVTSEFFWLDSLHPTSHVHKLLAKGVKSFLAKPTWLPHEDDSDEVSFKELGVKEIR